tara:strand:+ start:15641 stop:15910 length:270 start_codon:yes stop_codon:yes gene_type:complete
MKKCLNKKCFLHALTLLANVVVIAVLIIIYLKSYGSERSIALLFMIPPVLSILALRCGGDREERAMKNRIRKAHLRKELKELSEFDTDA